MKHRLSSPLIAFDRLMALLAVFTITAACSDSTDRGTAATVRDSAGIEIVENGGPAFSSPQWALSSEPVLAIGEFDGPVEYQLYQARGAVRLSDGRVVVANAGSHEVRWYTPDGVFQGAAGREGGGPGEFGGMGSIGRIVGDSVMVYDFRHRRVSVFGPQALFARSFLLELAETFAAAVTPLHDGRVHVSAGSIFGAEPSTAGLERRDMPHFLVSRTGALIDTLGIFPGREMWVRTDADRLMVASRAFGLSGMVEVAEEFFYAGDTGVPEVTLHRLTDGAVVRRVRWSAPRPAVTDAVIAIYREEQVEAASDRWREATRERLDAMPYPETFPAFSSLYVDALNYLWVRQYPLPGTEAQSWWIFDPDGRLLFTLPTPDGLRITDVGRDYLLGVFRDDLEVEYVLMYALDRGSAG